VLVIMTVATVAILCVPQVICIYQGCHQRCEQFIIYAIREKYGLHDDGTILPKNYSPFGKAPEKELCILAPFGLKKGTGDLIQGLYGEIVAIISIVQYIIMAMTLVKLVLASAPCCCYIATMLLSLAFMTWVAHYACRRTAKYEERMKGYNEYNKPEEA